jgi:hypothetical protein
VIAQLGKSGGGLYAATLLVGWREGSVDQKVAFGAKDSDVFVPLVSAPREEFYFFELMGLGG